MFVLLQQPRTYDDCILENMKGVSSDRAAMRIAGACRSKFLKEINLVPVNPEQNAFVDPDENKQSGLVFDDQK